MLDLVITGGQVVTPQGVDEGLADAAAASSLGRRVGVALV